jgi:hypothetical protein
MGAAGDGMARQAHNLSGVQVRFLIIGVSFKGE